jgi:uncharacterized membrane protein
MKYFRVHSSDIRHIEELPNNDLEILFEIKSIYQKDNEDWTLNKYKKFFMKEEDKVESGYIVFIYYNIPKTKYNPNLQLFNSVEEVKNLKFLNHEKKSLNRESIFDIWNKDLLPSVIELKKFDMFFPPKDSLSKYQGSNYRDCLINRKKRIYKMDFLQDENVKDMKKFYSSAEKVNNYKSILENSIKVTMTDEEIEMRHKTSIKELEKKKEVMDNYFNYPKEGVTLNLQRVKFSSQPPLYCYLDNNCKNVMKAENMTKILALLKRGEEINLKDMEEIFLMDSICREPVNINKEACEIALSLFGKVTSLEVVLRKEQEHIFQTNYEIKFKKEQKDLLYKSKNDNERVHRVVSGYLEYKEFLNTCNMNNHHWKDYFIHSLREDKSMSPSFKMHMQTMMDTNFFHWSISTSMLLLKFILKSDLSFNRKLKSFFKKKGNKIEGVNNFKDVQESLGMILGSGLKYSTRNKNKNQNVFISYSVGAMTIFFRSVDSNSITEADC